MGIVKIIHITCALLSISGLVIRGIMGFKDSPYLTTWAVKKLPHIIDSVLLICAVILAFQWGWAALQMPWLLTKLGALLVYISLGMIALRAGRSKPVRITALLGAVGVFGYIVSVAITKDPFLISS